MFLKQICFHVAVRLFSNRSQMTSKCGNNISDTLGYRLVCHFFVITTFYGKMESICFIYNKETTTAFLFQNLNYSKAGLCPLWQAQKKAFWHNLFSIQNEAIWTENILKKQLFENYDLTKITWSPCLSIFKQIQNDQLLMRFQRWFPVGTAQCHTLMFLKIINSHLMECRLMFVTNYIPNIWGLSNSFSNSLINFYRCEVVSS